MGLLQRALETYEAHAEKYAGVYHEGQSEPLAPIGCSVKGTGIEITLDRAGAFIGAELLDKNAPKVIIPVTEASAGRTSAPCAHPLCDNIEYVYDWQEEFEAEMSELLSGNDEKAITRHKKNNETQKEKFSLYTEQLEKWTARESSEHVREILNAVLTYVRQRTVKKDLVERTGLTEAEIRKAGLIRWRVIGTKDDTPAACWTDRELFRAFAAAYQAATDEGSEEVEDICMISGEPARPAKQHSKGIFSLNGNAKLISANDTSGFTFRGRFVSDRQAVNVSYESSQKVHNALQWVIANQKVVFGGRAFVCWTPQGERFISPVDSFFSSEETVFTASDYREHLRNAMLGKKSELGLNGIETAVIAAFDAATSGRLAVTYYGEHLADTLLTRLEHWDAHCCWQNGRFGIQSPSLQQIVSRAFGTQREGPKGAFMAADDSVMKNQLQRLIECRFEAAPMPPDIVKSLVQKVSAPQAYERNVWENLLFTACSTLCKRLFDIKGEDAMDWDLDKKDRSFQFGRLLAAMERAELDFYSLTNENRETNAIKVMSVFRQRPFKTYEMVNRQLHQAYLPRISGWSRSRYEKLCGEITALLSEFPEKELNKPLEDSYIMGYTLQRNTFFEKKQNEAEEN